MEKARLRRFDFALLQNQQTGSGWAAIKTQLRFHFHSHFAGVGNEDFPARRARHGQCRQFLSCIARWPHSVLAGRVHLCGHLHRGDLLLLIVMHAEIAREGGGFDIDNLLSDVTEKLIRRHPHVFGKSDARDSGAVLKQWESIKRAEKTGKHYLDGLPAALPALMRAQKAQSKAARVNFDWAVVSDVIAKVEEEHSELKQAIASGDEQSIEDEVGDLLFAVVNLARKCKLDAESMLQTATDKFVARFNRLEDELQARGKRLGDVDLGELDAIWNEIKKMAKSEWRMMN